MGLHFLFPEASTAHHNQPGTTCGAYRVGPGSSSPGAGAESARGGTNSSGEAAGTRDRRRANGHNHPRPRIQPRKPKVIQISAGCSNSWSVEVDKQPGAYLL